MLRPHAHDLFGDVPVYPQDIDCWLLSVPKIEPGSPRAEAYIRGFDVVSKIKHAKRHDDFDAMIDALQNKSGGYVSHCRCRLAQDHNHRR